MTEVHKVTRSQSGLTPADRPWRIAFPHVHVKRTKRPNGQPLDKPRYDATLLAPKLHSDPAQCPNYKLLAAHCMEAATQAWGPAWPQGGHWPIQDGDAPPKPKAPVPGQAAAAPKDYPWRKGHWVIEVGNNLDPGPRVAILQNGQPVEIPSQTVAGRTLYKSGDYVVASISAYTFNKNGKFGCNFGFDGVMFVAEGEAIGTTGPRSAAQMFGQVAGVPAQAAPPAAAPTYAPPVQAAPVAPVAAPPAPTYAPPPPAAAPVAPPPAAPSLPPFPPAH